MPTFAHVGARHSTLAACACTLLLAACTEPSFEPSDAALSDADLPATTADASDPSALPSGADAGAQAPVAGGDDAAPSVAAERSALLGRYVKRTISFGRDVDVNGQRIVLRAIESSIVDITEGDAGTLQLTSRLCSMASNWLVPDTTTLTLRRPDLVPPLEQTLELDPETGHYVAREAHRYAGFEPSRESRCAGQPAGARVERYSDQVWVSSGQCLCAGGGGPPITQDDCRLDDLDRDGKAGVALVLHVEFLDDREMSVSFEAASQLEFTALDPGNGQHAVKETVSVNPSCSRPTEEFCYVGVPERCGVVTSQWLRAKPGTDCSSFQAGGGERLPSLPTRGEGCDGP